MKHNCKRYHFMACDLSMVGTYPKTLSNEQRVLLKPQRWVRLGMPRKGLEYLISVPRS